MALFDISGVNPPYPNGLTPRWVDKINTLVTTATDDQTAAEIRTLVEAATNSNVFTDADHTALSSIRVEGGGVVLKGTVDPTSGGANTGDDSIIVGDGNADNSGEACIIGGEENTNNSGDACLIVGEDNSHNSGYHCFISGKDNYNNSGDYCSISGRGNHTNSGSHSTIGGMVASGSTITATSGTSASTGLVTKASHGVTVNQPLRFTTLTGLADPPGLLTSTTYYARDILTDTFAVALTPGGSAVTITGPGYTVANYIANATNYGNFNTVAGEDNEGNSGSWCNISGDQNHTNSGDYCSISGYSNYTNSGVGCLISGISNHSNSGDYCSISGLNASDNAFDYARVHGGKTHARLIDLVAQIDSIGTGATELLLGGTGGTRIIIPDQSAWACEINFVAKTATGGTSRMQRVHGLLTRDDAGATNTVWVAGVEDTVIGTGAATFAVAADTTNEALKLTVTAASGVYRCVASIKLTQVDF